MFLIARECDPAASDMWKHSTREFGHTCKNRDSAFEASRTFVTAPRPRRKESRIDQNGRATENCKIGTSGRTKPTSVDPHLQLITGEGDLASRV